MRGVLAANQAAAQFYHEVLLSSEGKKALQYLQQRHLTPEIIEKFCLGYAPDKWNVIENFYLKAFPGAGEINRTD